MAKNDPQTPEQIREEFAAEPGKGHLAEQALAELANAEAYGADPTAARKRLAALGLGDSATPADRKAAAAERRAALEELSSGHGRSGADPPVSYPENPDADGQPAGDGQAGDGQAASGDADGGQPGDDGAKAGDPSGDGGQGDGKPAGDAAASGDGDGKQASGGKQAGDDDAAAKARKTVTAGRKPGGPKQNT